MMRSILTTVFLAICCLPAFAQQRVARSSEQQRSGEAGRNASVAAPPQRPFPQLGAEAQEQLQQLLTSWEKTSNATKTLECRFDRWTYRNGGAPAGVATSMSIGTIRYAAPDKGRFKVDQLVFYSGMNEQGKPTYKAQEGKYGEWWVCNGTDVLEFDRTEKECRIQTLPPEMRGTKIFNSPLPFVFNLDAQQIQQRYWLRLVAAPNPNVHLVEAWPKYQSDRAQYRLVQIALDKNTLLPAALVMYAPNFDVQMNPEWQHYEFSEVKQNSAGQRLQGFFNSWIQEKPPADWKVLRDSFAPPARSAATPQSGASKR